MRSFLCIALLACLSCASARAADDPAALILKSGTDYYSLASKFSYLEDRTKDLEVDDVRHGPLNGDFMKPQEGQTAIGFRDSAMWLRMDITNADHPSRPWVMELWSVPTDRADIYVYQGSHLIKSDTTGGNFPGRLKRASYYGLNFNVPTGETRTIYLRLESSQRMRAPVALFTPEAVSDRDYQKQLVMGLLLGIGIALVLYNLGLFFSIRDYSYLFYSIYGLAVWTLIIGENGYVDLFSAGHLPRWSVISHSAMATVLFFALLFARSFLKTKYLTPKADVVIQVVLGLLAVTGVASLLGPASFRVITAGNVLDILLLSTISMMILAGALTLKAGYRPAKLYLVSWTAALSMVLIWLAEAKGLIPTSVVTRFCAEIGIALEMILKSLGLADRVTVIREELVRVLASQKHDLETRVRERTREIEVKNEVLSQSAKMAALGEMAAAIAHEINNPLGIIVAGSENLQMMIDRPEIDRAKSKIQAKELIATSMRMARIVRGLLAYSRKSVGEQFVRRELAGIIEDTVEFCRERLRTERVELLLKPVPQDFEVLCHPDEISEILVNLLNNSRDALRNLPEEDRWISVEVVEKNQFLEIRVTDNGHGVPKSVQNRIFNPFFTTKEVGQGTGLGLSIAKGIAESHGGALEYNAQSLNTQFILRLPRARENKTNSAA